LAGVPDLYVDGDSQITLADYLAVLKRRWLVIAVVLLAGVVASAAALAFSTKIYKATATIRVATGVGGTDVLRAVRVRAARSGQRGPTVAEVSKMRGAGLTVRELARHFGVSHVTILDRLKKAKR